MIGIVEIAQISKTIHLNVQNATIVLFVILLIFTIMPCFVGIRLLKWQNQLVIWEIVKVNVL